MTALSTPNKPAKAPRTIVSTKVTADGVKTTISVSAVAQLQRAFELCEMLKQVPTFADEAHVAWDGLGSLLKRTGHGA